MNLTQKAGLTKMKSCDTPTGSLGGTDISPICDYDGGFGFSYGLPGNTGDDHDSLSPNGKRRNIWTTSPRRQNEMDIMSQFNSIWMDKNDSNINTPKTNNNNNNNSNSNNNIFSINSNNNNNKNNNNMSTMAQQRLDNILSNNDRNDGVTGQEKMKKRRKGGRKEGRKDGRIFNEFGYDKNEMMIYENEDDNLNNNIKSRRDSKNVVDDTTTDEYDYGVASNNKHSNNAVTNHHSSNSNSNNNNNSNETRNNNTSNNSGNNNVSSFFVDNMNYRIEDSEARRPYYTTQQSRSNDGDADTGNNEEEEEEDDVPDDGIVFGYEAHSAHSAHSGHSAHSHSGHSGHDNDEVGYGFYEVSGGEATSTRADTNENSFLGDLSYTAGATNTNTHLHNYSHSMITHNNNSNNSNINMSNGGAYGGHLQFGAGAGGAGQVPHVPPLPPASGVVNRTRTITPPQEQQTDIKNNRESRRNDNYGLTNFMSCDEASRAIEREKNEISKEIVGKVLNNKKHGLDNNIDNLNIGVYQDTSKFNLSENNNNRFVQFEKNSGNGERREHNESILYNGTNNGHNVTVYNSLTRNNAVMQESNSRDFERQHEEEQHRYGNDGRQENKGFVGHNISGTKETPRRRRPPLTSRARDLIKAKEEEMKKINQYATTLTRSLPPNNNNKDYLETNPYASPILPNNNNNNNNSNNTPYDVDFIETPVYTTAAAAATTTTTTQNREFNNVNVSPRVKPPKRHKRIFEFDNNNNNKHNNNQSDKQEALKKETRIIEGERVDNTVYDIDTRTPIETPIETPRDIITRQLISVAESGTPRQMSLSHHNNIDDHQDIVFSAPVTQGLSEYHPFYNDEHRQQAQNTNTNAHVSVETSPRSPQSVNNIDIYNNTILSSDNYGNKNENNNNNENGNDFNNGNENETNGNVDGDNSNEYGVGMNDLPQLSYVQDDMNDINDSNNENELQEFIKDSEQLQVYSNQYEQYTTSALETQPQLEQPMQPLQQSQAQAQGQSRVELQLERERQVIAPTTCLHDSNNITPMIEQMTRTNGINIIDKRDLNIIGMNLENENTFDMRSPMLGYPQNDNANIKFNNNTISNNNNNSNINNRMNNSSVNVLNVGNNVNNVNSVNYVNNVNGNGMSYGYTYNVEEMNVESQNDGMNGSFMGNQTRGPSLGDGNFYSPYSIGDGFDAFQNQQNMNQMQQEMNQMNQMTQTQYMQQQQQQRDVQQQQQMQQEMAAQMAQMTGQEAQGYYGMNSNSAATQAQMQLEMEMQMQQQMQMEMQQNMYPNQMGGYNNGFNDFNNQNNPNINNNNNQGSSYNGGYYDMNINDGMNTNGMNNGMNNGMSIDMNMNGVSNMNHVSTMNNMNNLNNMNNVNNVNSNNMNRNNNNNNVMMPQITVNGYSTYDARYITSEVPQTAANNKQHDERSDTSNSHTNKSNDKNNNQKYFYHHSNKYNNGNGNHHKRGKYFKRQSSNNTNNSNNNDKRDKSISAATHMSDDKNDRERDRHNNSNNNNNNEDAKMNDLSNTNANLLGIWDLTKVKTKDLQYMTPPIELCHCIEQNMILTLAKDQYGSRFIQKQLENATMTEKDLILKQIDTNVLELCENVFGNYIIQKLFDYGSERHKRFLAEKLIGNVYELSISMYGCRVIQKAFECLASNINNAKLNNKLMNRLLNELHGHIDDCIVNPNGNHVIQKCISVMPNKKDIQFIIDSFVAPIGNNNSDTNGNNNGNNSNNNDTASNSNISFYSTHPYGCRVIQRLLEYCQIKQQKLLLREILKIVLPLSKDQYGNYVIQHVLEHDKTSNGGQARAKIIEIVAQNMLYMSQNKYGSNVVEKAFIYAKHELGETDMLLDALIGINIRNNENDNDNTTNNSHNNHNHNNSSNSGNSHGEKVMTSNGYSSYYYETTSPLKFMVSDQFGNYVVQKVFDTVNDQQRERLFEKIKQLVPNLAASTFGVHIIAKMDKLRSSGSTFTNGVVSYGSNNARKQFH